MSRDMGSTLLVRGQAPRQALPRTRPERINFLTHIINKAKQKKVFCFTSLARVGLGGQKKISDVPLVSLERAH